MERNDGWDFDAPQFIDFANGTSFPDDDKAEEYFEFDHENGIPVQMEELPNTPATDVFLTPESSVKRITRSTAKTPQAQNDTPKTRSKATPNHATKSKTPDAAKSMIAQKTPEAINTEEKKDDDTPCARETRSLRSKTPNTVEKQPEKPAAPKSTKPSNVCTNIEEWRNKTAAAKQAKASKSGRETEETKPPGKRQNKSIDRTDKLPKRSKQEEPNHPSNRGSGTPSTIPTSTTGTGGGLKRSTSMRVGRNRSLDTSGGQGNKKHTRGLSGERTVRPRAGSASSEPEKQKPAMTIPTTPTFMKRKQMKMVPSATVKNSEEIEMEKIAYYRQELAKKRKQAQESYRTALAGQGTKCVANKEPTKPEEFHFQTDQRIKPHTSTERQEIEAKDFVRTLRSDSHKTAGPGPMKALPTRPEPFKLSEQRKRKLGDLDEKTADKYQTMAERVAAFTRTPERFRSKPKGGPSAEKRGRSKSPPGVTVPKTPNFETRSRSRPVNAPTRADLEQQELEEAQKNQFKAHPMNQRIFQNPNTGIRKVPRKAPTVCEEFHLSSNQKTHARDVSNDDDHFEFHAKPLNKKILEGIVGVKELKPLPITQPESPAFALKHRARLPVAEEQKEPSRPNTRSRPVPHFGVPFQPQLQHKTTEPTPFAFEEREKKRAEIKTKKIEQVYEEENKAREFHAQPLPSHETHLPPKRARPATEHKPFRLDTESRGAKKAAEWSKKLEEEINEQKERKRFHAREASVLDHEPFVPLKEKHHNIEISEFDFNTAKRLVKREAYEMSKKAHQDALDNIRQQEERMKQAEEQAELERMRRDAVHKANPVKHYKPIRVKPSDKPITQPMSPRFQTDSRLRSRAAQAESFMSA